MLTAEIAVRLSAKLELAGSHDQEATQDSIPPTPPDDGGGVQLEGTGGATTSTSSMLDTAIDSVRGLLQAPFKVLGGQPPSSEQQSNVAEPISDQATDEPSDGTTPKESATEQIAKLDITENDAGTAGKKSKKKKNKNKKSKKAAVPTIPTHQAGRFAHATAFDQLQDTLEVSEEDDAIEEVLQFDSLPSETAHASDPVVADTDGISDPRVAVAAWDEIPAAQESNAWEGRATEPGTAMPDFKSNFWKVYGNKLRVFGTQEGVAVLG